MDPLIIGKKWAGASEGDRKRLEVITVGLRNHLHLVERLFNDDKAEMVGGPKVILDIVRAWSSGEQVLARFACDVWFNRAHADLPGIVLNLDDENFQNVLEAMILWRQYFY